MSVLITLLLIVGIVLIVFDVVAIVKARKVKKSMSHNLDPELANNVLQALSDMDTSDIQANFKKSVEDAANSSLVHKEVNK